MSYNQGFRMLLQALGITNERLPVDGLPRREIFGVTFWVNPLPPREPGARFRRFKLRVMCECRICGQEMSASRLQQHAGSARCLKNAKPDVLASMIPARCSVPVHRNDGRRPCGLLISGVTGTCARGHMHVISPNAAPKSYAYTKENL